MESERETEREGGGKSFFFDTSRRTALATTPAERTTATGVIFSFFSFSSRSPRGLAKPAPLQRRGAEGSLSLSRPANHDERTALVSAAPPRDDDGRRRRRCGEEERFFFFFGDHDAINICDPSASASPSLPPARSPAPVPPRRGRGTGVRRQRCAHRGRVRSE